MAARVMIVEDEQIVAADLESKLRRMGHEIVGITASGEDAVRIAEEVRPELVLMDIQLQGPMSGIEAAKRIQRNTAAQIIFITAYVGVFLRDPTQMQPPGMCVSKPFSQYELQAALDAVVRKSI
jgi:CheY-like chemotaxis protein